MRSMSPVLRLLTYCSKNARTTGVASFIAFLVMAGGSRIERGTPGSEGQPYEPDAIFFQWFAASPTRTLHALAANVPLFFRRTSHAGSRQRHRQIPDDQGPPPT